MRSLWMMLVSGLAVIMAAGGTVYYIFPTESGRNPLLTANVGQFDRWVPFYPIRCGEILFERAEPTARHYAYCVDEIRRRVGRATDKKLSREDVLDPQVKSRWREVTGDK